MPLSDIRSELSYSLMPFSSYLTPPRLRSMATIGLFSFALLRGWQFLGPPAPRPLNRAGLGALSPARELEYYRVFRGITGRVRHSHCHHAWGRFTYIQQGDTPKHVRMAPQRLCRSNDILAISMSAQGHAVMLCRYKVFMLPFIREHDAFDIFILDNIYIHIYWLQLSIIARIVIWWMSGHNEINFMLPWHGYVGYFSNASSPSACFSQFSLQPFALFFSFSHAKSRVVGGSLMPS